MKSEAPEPVKLYAELPRPRSEPRTSSHGRSAGGLEWDCDFAEDSAAYNF